MIAGPGATLMLALTIGGIILVIAWGLWNAQLEDDRRERDRLARQRLRRELDRQPDPNDPPR